MTSPYPGVPGGRRGTGNTLISCQDACRASTVCFGIQFAGDNCDFIRDESCDYSKYRAEGSGNWRIQSKECFLEPWTSTTATTTTTPDIRYEAVKCNHPVDFGFLLDESGSIGRDNFPLMLDFAARLVDSFELGASATQSRAGVVVFGGNPHIRASLSESVAGNTYVKNAIRGTRFGRTSTDTAAGLKMMRQMVNGMRSAAGGIARVVVVITDGQANDRRLAATEAASLKADGVVVIAVGVKGYDLNELRQMATSANLVFTITDFSTMLESVQALSQKVCISPADYKELTYADLPPSARGCIDLQLRAADSCDWTNHG